MSYASTMAGRTTASAFDNNAAASHTVYQASFLGLVSGFNRTMSADSMNEADSSPFRDEIHATVSI